MKGMSVIEGEKRLTPAEQTVIIIKEELENIKERFFVVGYYLNVAQKKNEYYMLGYPDIYSYAEQEFGLGRTSTKNLMEVNRTYSTGFYSAPTKELSAEWKGYSQTQLVEMLPLGPTDRQNITKDFTAQDLRDLKKICDVRFDTYKNFGVASYEISKNPRIYIDLYRKQKKDGVLSGESYTAKEHTSLMKNLDALIKPKKADEIPPGQLVLNDNDEIEEFHQSGAEEVAPIQTTEKGPSAFVKMFDEPVHQPDKHNLRNDTQREEFITDENNFPAAVIDNEELGLKISRCDFANGAKLYRIEGTRYSIIKGNFEKKVSYALVDESDRKMPKTAGFFQPDCKTFSLNGNSMTFILDYMSKYAKEI